MQAGLLGLGRQIRQDSVRETALDPRNGSTLRPGHAQGKGKVLAGPCRASGVSEEGLRGSSTVWVEFAVKLLEAPATVPMTTFVSTLDSRQGGLCVFLGLNRVNERCGRGAFTLMPCIALVKMLGRVLEIQLSCPFNGAG